MGFRKDIKENVDFLQKEYGDLSELVYRLSNRLDNLFKWDHNETLKPKVDLLTALFYSETLAVGYVSVSTLFFIFFYIFS